MKKSIVCYRLNMIPESYNAFWEPERQHSPSESTPIYSLSAASKEDIVGYRDSYCPKANIIYR